jgi:phosphatidate cytidylyltransferase
MSRETGRRILHAVPLILLAIVIVVAGGAWFAGGLAAIGILGIREFLAMAQEKDPLPVPMYLGLIGFVLAAALGTETTILLALAVPFPLLFFFALRRRDRTGITVALSVSLLGLYWIGIPLIHAILLRDIPDYGTGLLVDVLIGTFVADTGAYAVGRLFGSRPLAPRLSPNKTVEGLLGGIVLGIVAVWAAGLYQDWLSGTDALILGAAVALTAPIGDLFESMLKRDLGTKDAGGVFGAHGGVLDRLDAVFFTVVVGYYVSLALI